MKHQRRGQLISIRNVDVSINGQRILSDISWQINPGEHWAFIGSNGSGKSTLLKLIRSDIWPDVKSKGKRIYGFGEDGQESPIGVKKHIGIVSPELQDSYAKHVRDMSGEEVIHTGFFDSAWLHQEPTEAQKKSAEDMIRLLRLDDIMDKSFLEMSQGEARKILIARALVSNPEVLILDEFCNGLDAPSRRKVLSLVERVGRTGTQILYATHRVEELIPSITHVLFLKNGRIIHQGRKDEVFTPENLSRVMAADTTLRYKSIRKDKKSSVQPDKSGGNEKYLIKIKNADVFLKNRKILHDINWKMNRDENWAILGKNGAGKSTLLKLILGDVHPALGGEIQRFGRKNSESLWNIRKRIGFVSSEIRIDYAYHINGVEVVQSGFFSSIGLYNELTDEQKETAQRWIEFFHINNISEKEVTAMSYGELRKMIIVRSMVNSPDILVLDEPCSGLDSSARSDFLDTIEHLSHTGTRIILITHHLDEIIPSITHIMVMDKGRIIAKGKKEDILKNEQLSALFDEADKA